MQNTLQKKISKTVLTILISVSLIFGGICAFAEDYKEDIKDKQQDISDVKKEISNIQKEKEQRQKELSELAKQISDIEYEKNLNLTNEEIAINELTFLKESIENFDQEIQNLQRDHDILEQSCLERARIMFQSSSDFELIQMFFSSKNIFDFVEKLDIYKKMIQEDKELMEELKQSEKILSEKKKQQEELFSNKEVLLEEIDAAIIKLQSNETIVEGEYSNLADLLLSFEDQEQGYYTVLDDLSNELNELEKKQKAAEEAARKAEEERLRKEAEAKAAKEAAEKARLEAEAKAAAEAAAKAKAEAEAAAKAKAEAEAAAKAKKTPTAEEANFCWPLPYNRGVTSSFGYRNHPLTGKWSLHTGVDLGATTGTNIYAAQDGYVTLAKENGGFGLCIIIDHGNGLKTLYGHCSKLLVSVGDKITRGQIIGLVGMTGSATGPHLHFEVQLNNTPVEPLAYIEKQDPNKINLTKQIAIKI